jgi:hypothetical protein
MLAESERVLTGATGHVQHSLRTDSGQLSFEKRQLIG